MSPELVPFGRIVTSIRNGLSPATDGTYEGEVLTLSAVTQGRFDQGARKAAVFGTPPRPDQRLRPGMFLVCRGNGNLALVGSGVVVPSDADVSLVFPDTIIGVDLDLRCVDPAYLAFAWRTRSVRSQIEAGARTTNGTHKVNQQVLEALRIPLPPLTEQRRIAALLDEANALRRKRRESLALLDDLLRATFLDMFGDPVTNPLGWELADLGSACEIVTGNTPSRERADYYGNDIEWIKSDNINTPAHYVTRAKEGLSRAGLQVGRSVDAGATLMTCIAGSPECIGNVAMADRAVSFNQQINALIPGPRVQSEYLYSVLLVGKKLVQSQSTESMKGMVSKGRLARVQVPVPPMPMQQNWRAAFLEHVEHNRRARMQQVQLEQLFDSLLHRAFSGAL